MVVPQRTLDLASASDSLSDLVFRTLSTAICDGTLESGETLRLSDLRAWLGVSRTPIREALARLVTLGLVSTQPGRYTKVVRPDRTVHTDTIELLGYQGGMLLRMTVGELSDVVLAAVVTLLDETGVAAEDGDPTAWRSALRRFLDYMWAVANRPVAQQAMGDLALVIDANLRHAAIVPSDRRVRSEAYARLRDAIEQRDPEYAEYAFRVLYPPRVERDGDVHAESPTDRSTEQESR
ncbi:MAG: GntR family transcriptional regulator [Microbacterium sp.]